MKKTIFFFHFLLFIFISAGAQTDPCNIRISLLTCTPGEELYSTFGHSALRVNDTAMRTDIIYNYGTFNFDDPDFYSKFIRGKLLYFVSIDSFNNFAYEYQYEKRGIIEQTLNLSCTEKQRLLSALEQNAKEENKYYKYDFVYDNCTTRLLDIVSATSSDSLIIKDIRPRKNITFRNLIHEYLDKGGQYWSKLGIDMLLGSPLDKKISNREAMFLPDYLLKGFDSTTKKNENLVAGKALILPAAMPVNNNRLFTPTVIFIVLFLIVAFLSLMSSKKAKTFLYFFDVFFFFACGAIGCLILFMWLGTDHPTCKNNFNILWALPTHLIIAFLLHKKTAWVKTYFRFTSIVCIALILLWFFLPQEMNIALLPVTAIILVRSFYLGKKFKT